MLDKEINEMIENALKDLYKEEGDLIYRQKCDNSANYHNSERNIAFHFGTYLKKYLLETSYKHYNIDVEFNRNKDEVKKIDGRNCIPDIIIHKRGDNDNNLLVIEIKTWWNRNVKSDKEKLSCFTGVDYEYKYLYGLLVIIGEKRDLVDLTWFKNGKEIKKEE